jgi:HAD superfamily phosphoserine phosphatase-like hydrolase
MSNHTPSKLKPFWMVAALWVACLAFVPGRAEARGATGYWKQQRDCRIHDATQRARVTRLKTTAPSYRPSQHTLSSWVLRSINRDTCRALGRLLASDRRGPATFDADGTLWAGDVGEGFFQWMLKHHHYPSARIPMLQQKWREYRAGTFDGEKMYELMVTAMAGMREAEVQRLATRYFDQVHMEGIYKPMATLVLALRESGFSPWVVSGSPRWVVAAGARHFGIPEANVIGLSVKVDAQGRLTDQIVRPVPWKNGKAKRILLEVGEAPLIAAGNSQGDIQMLRIAREVPLVINPSPDLRAELRTRGWPVNSFTAADTMARWMRSATR